MRLRLIYFGTLALAAVLCVLPARPALSLPPMQLSSQMLHSEDALNARRYHEAIERLDEMINSNALDAEGLALAHLNRGIAWQKSGDSNRASTDYDAALSAASHLPAPALVKGYYNRGILRAASGNTEAAIQDYDAALRVDPTYAAAYHNRANLARKAGDYADAVRDYNAALLYMRGDGRKYTLLGRGICQQQLGNRDAARDDFKKALAIDPDLATARAALAAISSGPTIEMAESRRQDDEIVTASLGPTAAATSREQVIKIASSGGWETVAIRYTATDLPPQAGYTGSVPPLRKQLVAPPPATTIAAASPVTATLPPATAAYRIQLAALRTQETAEEKWGELVARDGTLRGLAHQIEKADLGERGIFYRLQVDGFSSMSEAKALCSNLSSRNIDCFVVR